MDYYCGFAAECRSARSGVEMPHRINTCASRKKGHSIQASGNVKSTPMTWLTGVLCALDLATERRTSILAPLRIGYRLANAFAIWGVRAAVV
jgi:hypothetical protein